MSEDESVLQKYPYFFYLHAPTSFKASLEATLLVEIVRASENLDRRYLSHDACMELLGTREELREEVVRCWKEGSFRELRESALLLPQLSRSLCSGEEEQTMKNHPSHTMELHPSCVTAYECSFTEIHAGGSQIFYQNICYGVDDAVSKWIPFRDYSTIQVERLSERTGNTGRWLLESDNFIQWISSPRNRILWCPGDPGAGKTVLASVAIDYLKKQGNERSTTGFIYFDYEKRHEQTLDLVLGSLLRQVLQASKEESITRPIIRFYEAHYQQKTRPTVPELEVSLLDAYSKYSDVFLVFDALDEWMEDLHYQGVARLLETLLSLGGHVRLLFTSRNLGCIGRCFRAYAALCEEIYPRPTDIRLYVEERIEKDLSFASHFSSIISHRVLQTSQTSFLLARLHMDSLSRHLSPGDVLDALDGLSSDVDRVYDQLMVRIHQQDHYRCDLALRTLCWVAYGDSLSLDELRHALAVAPGRYSLQDYLCSAEVLTSVCAGLVKVDKAVHYSWGRRGSSKPSHSVSLIHHTAYEYFSRIKDSVFPTASADMARTCLTYLHNPVFTCQAPSSLTIEDYSMAEEPFCDDQLQNLLQEHRFLDYTLKMWGHHAATQEHLILEEILEYVSGKERVSFACLVDARIFGGTGIHLASFFGLEKTLSKLLDLGGDITSQTAGGSLHPLIVASSTGQKDIVCFLFTRLCNSNQFNLSIVDRHGRSAASYAAQHGHVDVLKMLLDLDSRLATQVDNDWRTPLSYAAFAGFRDVVQLLMGIPGHDLTSPDVFGHNPISYAIRAGHSDIVNLFLQLPTFDPNMGSIHGRTPLSFSAELFEYDIFELMLKTKRVDASIYDRFGRTALCYAAESGNFDAICMLLEHGGIELNACCSDMVSSMGHAMRNSHRYIGRLLFGEGAQQLLTRNGQLIQEFRRNLAEVGAEDLTACYDILQGLNKQLGRMEGLINHPVIQTRYMLES